MAKLRISEIGRSNGLCTPRGAAQGAAIELITRAAVASTAGWSLPDSVKVTSTWGSGRETMPRSALPVSPVPWWATR
jgi:hypothetical protein